MSASDWSLVMDNPVEFTREDAAWAEGRPVYGDMIASAIPKGVTSALEIGCGGGYVLQALAKRVQVVVGVDKSINCVEASRRRNPELRIWHRDVRDLNLPRHDLVVATAFLKHFSIHEWPKILRILCEHARIYLMVSIGLGEEDKEDDGEYIHHTTTTRERFNAELARNSFTPIRDLDNTTEPVVLCRRLA